METYNFQLESFLTSQPLEYNPFDGKNVHVEILWRDRLHQDKKSEQIRGKLYGILALSGDFQIFVQLESSEIKTFHYFFELRDEIEILDFNLVDDDAEKEIKPESEPITEVHLDPRFAEELDKANDQRIFPGFSRWVKILQDHGLRPAQMMNGFGDHSLHKGDGRGGAKLENGNLRDTYCSDRFRIVYYQSPDKTAVVVLGIFRHDFKAITQGRVFPAFSEIPKAEISGKTRKKFGIKVLKKNRNL